MYIIAVYDVEAKRTVKFHKFLKKRLTWIQNSIFEGEVSDSQFFEIKNQMKKMCSKDESVILYTLFSGKYLDRVILGNKKDKEPSNIL